MTTQNPFVDLYVTENISAERFVNLFSTTLLDESDVLALYQPGNVILVGLQGSGKTALMNLLQPEVLIAYRRLGASWPLPERSSRFVSAGINLSKSGAIDFGQRPIEPYLNDANKRYALYFADFLNYWIVGDLLRSIEKLASADFGVPEYLGIKISLEVREKFANDMAVEHSWLGGLEEVSSYDQLVRVIDHRIFEYRNFLNYNSEELPEKIRKSKTSAGEPISSTVDLLRKNGILPSDIPVLIRIDQFEDLIGIEQRDEGEFRMEYRAVVFKMLGKRDDKVSYRVGARPYAVQQDFRMHGTSLVVEQLRNYTIVDIDQILRRKEHSRGLFPKFSEDVFMKRLQEMGFKMSAIKGNLIRHVFGGKPSPEERATSYVSKSVTGFIQYESEWPVDILEKLKDIDFKDPVSAKLSEAWIRQKLHQNKGNLNVDPLEWKNKRWWKKERVEQALLQIAAARKQRMVWGGADDILGLAGGNILVFLSICQLIWAEFLRADGRANSDVPQIHSITLQDIGIQQASEYWYRKLRADPNGGDDRYRFVSVLGGVLRNALREDKRMSYPGANGFSLSDRDIESDQEANGFLDLCSAYGALTVSRHTPKTSSRGISKKWYLFPILSPFFQLPVAHTKEPLYISSSDIRFWLAKADIKLKPNVRSNHVDKNITKLEFSPQMSLMLEGPEKNDSGNF